MTIQVEYEANRQLSISYEEIVQEIVLAVLEYEACPYEAEVNVLLTDNEAIQEINRDNRQVDAPTDVLSFPASDYETPADFDSLEERADCFHPETGELLLGDIVLSVEKILSQAE